MPAPHDDQLTLWIEELTRALDLDLDVDVAILLDVAKDAAHGVTRPAAPITTFVVGYAAARAGGGLAAVATAARTASQLANSWRGRTAGDQR